MTMTDKVSITLAYLPEEGKALSGELNSSALSTSEKDLVQPSSSMIYDLFVQRFDNELLVRGYLESTFTMICTQCNQEFLQTQIIEDFSQSIEIESGVVELNDFLREELFIQLPFDPNCQDADEKITCSPNSLHLTVDKPVDSDVNDPPAGTTEKKWTNNWDALKGLDNFPENKD